MRIATSRASSNYLKRLENNYSQKYNSEKKISTFRKFEYASEAPAQAASAMRVRKAIANLENYQENLKTAQHIYDTAESAVMSISELIQSTYEKCIEAANGTHTLDQMEILADEIDTFADEMVRLMNLTVADRRIFGGTNNTELAFRIEGVAGNRYVTYNGVSVNMYNDPSKYPYGNSSYTDVGLGMQLTDKGVVDEQSALKITFNGMEIVGCGVAASSAFIKNLEDLEEGEEYGFKLLIDGGGIDELNIKFTPVLFSDNSGVDMDETLKLINDEIANALKSQGYKGDGAIKVTNSGLIVNNVNGKQVTIVSTDSKLQVENQTTGYSNNVIQNILDAAECIRGGDGAAIARFADQVYSLQTTVSLALADFGHTTQFIEFNQNRITNNLYSLTVRQDDLESTDLEAESTIWKLLDSIYSASLQMTTKAIPQSIFDFI